MHGIQPQQSTAQHSTGISQLHSEGVTKVVWFLVFRSLVCGHFCFGLFFPAMDFDVRWDSPNFATRGICTLYYSFQKHTQEKIIKG
jgi:hypothetical protein